jgi:ADP-heptose:LPS heptosyltransferase
LGDTVVALPCFHRIARSFPNSRRVVVTDSPVSQKIVPVESVLRNSGLIDDVIYFPPPPRNFRDLFALRTRVRKTKATTLIYVADRKLHETLRDLCFFYGCGIRRIIGAPLARDSRTLRRHPKTGHTEREAERLARCLASIGPIDLTDAEMWDLRLQPNELRAADDALASLGDRDFIVGNFACKVQNKHWGDDNWQALLRLMTKQYSHTALVLVGSADEFDRSAIVAAEWRGPVLNLCGQLATRESAAAMRHGLFFLGHDGGPMHLAAAVGIPCVAVFGPHNMPKWWHPMGPRHHVIHNMNGIQEIRPTEVLEAIERLMSEIYAERGIFKAEATGAGRFAVDR